MLKKFVGDRVMSLERPVLWSTWKLLKWIITINILYLVAVYLIKLHIFFYKYINHFNYKYNFIYNKIDNSVRKL